MFLDILLVEFNSIQVKQIHKYRTVTRQATENPKQGEASVNADWTPQFSSVPCYYRDSTGTQRKITKQKGIKIIKHNQN